jgi:uncharacterized alkaline shock family protein YloU
MSQAPHPAGRIEISHKAIATLAAQAAVRSYGVVGMASRNLVDGIVYLLARDPRHGVEVTSSGGQVGIDLYIVVEYGTRVSSVAESVAHTVRYQVERALGMPIAHVNIHVQDLRVSNVD